MHQRALVSKARHGLPSIGIPAPVLERLKPQPRVEKIDVKTRFVRRRGDSKRPLFAQQFPDWSPTMSSVKPISSELSETRSTLSGTRKSRANRVLSEAEMFLATKLLKSHNLTMAEVAVRLGVTVPPSAPSTPSVAHTRRIELALLRLGR